MDGNTSASVIVLENQNFVTEVNATDIDGDTLTYLISGGTDQSKFDINSSSGEITFKSAPDFEAPADSNSDNLYTVEITVSDDDTTSLSDIQNISVFVTNSDDSPVVANPLSDFTVNEDATDSTIDLSNVFNDVDNNNAAIVKSVTSSNNSLVNASVAGNTLTLDYQPNQSGSATITVTANSNGKTVDDVFSVTVNPVDDSPVVANPLSDITVNEDAVNSIIDLSNVFNDVDDNNASITKSVTSSDSSLVNASIVGNTLTLDYQPNQSGSATITVTANSNGKTVDDVFST